MAERYLTRSALYDLAFSRRPVFSFSMERRMRGYRLKWVGAFNEPKKIELFPQGGHVDLFEHGMGEMANYFE